MIHAKMEERNKQENVQVRKRCFAIFESFLVKIDAHILKTLVKINNFDPKNV